jgi:hypothetical protein
MEWRCPRRTRNPENHGRNINSPATGASHCRESRRPIACAPRHLRSGVVAHKAGMSKHEAVELQDRSDPDNTWRSVDVAFESRTYHLVWSRNSNGMKWRGLGFAQVPFSNGLLRSRNSAYNLAFMHNFVKNYCSFAYSALAAMRIGMSGSASFQSVRKS